MALIECPECGSQISDKALACPKCGAPNKVFKTQSELDKSQNNSYEYMSDSYDWEDEDELGLTEKILSFLIWPVGVLFWLTKKETEPEAASSALKWTLYGIVCSSFLCCILLCS